MARITEITKIEKTRNSIRSDADCTYCVFYVNDEKYFQLETYGSSGRKEIQKTSQNIQFDKEFAIKLIQILKKEFNI
ncbi:MAG: methionyl-tRNA formyltransferase [Clostridiaceae bacterium]|jgi:hypothetical protein|nr:methionyl-tRNA formyltransferase [Clostridiaceae bacterium]